MPHWKHTSVTKTKKLFSLLYVIVRFINHFHSNLFVFLSANCKRFHIFSYVFVFRDPQFLFSCRPTLSRYHHWISWWAYSAWITWSCRKYSAVSISELLYWHIADILINNFWLSEKKLIYWERAWQLISQEIKINRETTY